MSRPNQGNPPTDPPGTPPVDPPRPQQINPPRRDLVYPHGAAEDRADRRRKSPPAQRGGDGQYLDPESGMPVEFPLDDPPPGMTWTTQDLLDKRDAWRALGPALPTAAPPLTEQERADRGEGVQDIPPDARSAPQTPTNLDDARRPHFLRSVNGEEVCGQDGNPWPCATWSSWVAESDAVPTARPVADGATMSSAEAAEALGVDPQELALFLASRNRT